MSEIGQPCFGSWVWLNLLIAFSALIQQSCMGGLIQRDKDKIAVDFNKLQTRTRVSRAGFCLATWGSWERLTKNLFVLRHEVRFLRLSIDVYGSGLIFKMC